ncbi:MAG: DNA polymerase III subunit delta, partial [Clostridiales bacterium]|nr:DNA polymerase III subunit delta [Clostridiales bacterium]
MKTIADDIRTGQLKHVYLLYGEESYLIRQYLGNLKSALAGDDTVNTAVFEGKDVNVGEIIDLAETMPFFSDHRTIIVKNSELFKIGKKKKTVDSSGADDAGSADEANGADSSGNAALLADYMKDIPETTYLVFTENDVDKRSRFFKQINKYGHAAEFRRQPESVLMKWVLSRLKKEGKNITRPVMDLFLQKTGDDMEVIANELAKLLSYTMDRNMITAEDVETICTTQISDKIFAMIDAIADKRQERALELYYDLLMLKEPPMKILTLITRQFNVLLQLKYSASKGYDNKTLAAKLGVRDFVVRKGQGQMRKFSTARLKAAVEDGIAAEEDIKSGKMNDRLAVELFLIKYSK